MSSPPAPRPAPPHPSPPPGKPLLLAVVVCGAAALGLIGGAELAWGPTTRIAFEEAQNARAALLIACGHISDWRALQYRPFCGGCTVDALAAAPLLRILGPTEGVFKLVPIAFTALAGGLCAALAASTGGLRAAFVAIALLAAAPAVAIELAMTGWGNHAEGLALPLAGLVLLAGPASPPGLLRGALSGALFSLGVYYTASTAWALAVALTLAAAASPRALLGLCAALPVGLLPWALTQQVDPAQWLVARDRWAQLVFAAPAQLWRWMVAEALRPGVLWPTTGPTADAVGAVAAGATGALGLLGAVMGVVRAAPTRWQRARGAAPGLGLLALSAAYTLRADLWAAEPELWGYAPFSWRYRAALLPLLTWAAASWVARLHGRAALLAGAVVAAVVGHGLWRRLDAWPGEGLAPGLGRPIALAPGPDPTLPGGAPRLRRVEARVRSVDLQAGALALRDHIDPIPACQAVHARALAERLGAGALDRSGAAEALAALDGIIGAMPVDAQPGARSWLAASWSDAPGTPGAAWKAAIPPTSDGAAAAAALTDGGARRPTPTAVAAQLPPDGTPAQAFRLGEGLGAALGCGAAGLLPAGHPTAASFAAGVAAGCAPWRWGRP